MTAINPIVKATSSECSKISTNFVLRAVIDPASRSILNVKTIDLNLEELKPFTHNYRMLFNGKPIGNARMQLSINEGIMYLIDHTDVPAFDINEITVAVMDANTTLPTKLTVSGIIEGTIDEVEYGFQDLKVVECPDYPGDQSESQDTIDVDSQLPENTSDRSAAFILASSIPIQNNEAYVFNWDRGLNDVDKEISLEVVSEEKVEVPLGTFDTYKVEMVGGDPSQILYITKSSPHMLVKIEILNVPWVYEMVSRVTE